VDDECPDNINLIIDDPIDLEEDYYP